MLVRIVDGSNEIVRVRLADSEAQALTSTPEREETWPFWSEAAQRLVYQVSTDGVRHDLEIWDPETRAATPLAHTALRDEQWPAWSPRRPELAFAFRGGAPPAGLGLADLTSGSRRLLAVSGRRDFFFRPSFAPDGASLVAQRRGESRRSSSLWRIRPGAAPSALTKDPAWFDMKPVFTRDGREILFSRRSAAGGPRDILAIASSGGAPRTLASTPASDDHSARPSPSRDEIAFVSDRGGRPAVYLAALDGADARPLAPDASRHQYAPRWSPDGERLVAITTPANVGVPRLDEPEALAEARVIVLDRDGRVLFDAPGLMPDWMPPWPSP